MGWSRQASLGWASEPWPIQSSFLKQIKYLQFVITFLFVITLCWCSIISMSQVYLEKTWSISYDEQVSYTDDIKVAVYQYCLCMLQHNSLFYYVCEHMTLVNMCSVTVTHYQNNYRTHTNFWGTYISLMSQIQHFRDLFLRITGFWHSIISMLRIINQFSRT